LREGARPVGAVTRECSWEALSRMDDKGSHEHGSTIRDTGVGSTLGERDGASPAELGRRGRSPAFRTGSSARCVLVTAERFTGPISGLWACDSRAGVSRETSGPLAAAHHHGVVRQSRRHGVSVEGMTGVASVESPRGNRDSWATFHVKQAIPSTPGLHLGAFGVIAGLPRLRQWDDACVCEPCGRATCPGCV